MKTLCKIAIIVVYCSVNTFGAKAQTIPFHFHGSACIWATSAACASEGWFIGNCARARYLPPNYEGSGNTTSLSLFWGFYSQNLRASGSVVGASFVDALFTGVSERAFTRPARMRIPGQAPADPTTANYLNMLVDIVNFQNACTVRLRFTGLRYPTTDPVSTPMSDGLASNGLSNGAASFAN